MAQMVSPMGNNKFERPPEDTLRYVCFVSKCPPSAGLWLKSRAVHPCDRDLVSGPARFPRVLCPLRSFERARGLGMCQGWQTFPHPHLLSARRVNNRQWRILDLVGMQHAPQSSKLAPFTSCSPLASRISFTLTCGLPERS